jgi:hypothetical protein
MSPAGTYNDGEAHDHEPANVTTSDHPPCMLSGMPGRAVRDHGDQPSVTAMLRVFCPSCCR